MPIVVIRPHIELCPEGASVEVESGVSICDALLNSGVEIEHACEKSCACTTCHVIVRKGFDSLNEPTEIEEDLLDKAWGLSPQSRLSCQAIIDNQDIDIEIPRYTINHAREHH